MNIKFINPIAISIQYTTYSSQVLYFRKQFVFDNYYVSLIIMLTVLKFVGKDVEP